MQITIKGDGDTLSGFRYFWMKNVRAFDDSKHCARCLVGSYSKAVSNRMKLNDPVTEDYPLGEIVYICGVSQPFNWENNFHMALKVTAGATAELPMFNGQTVIVEDAELIPFDSSVSDELYAGKSAAFLTCRNFQFGAYLASLS